MFFAIYHDTTVSLINSDHIASIDFDTTSKCTKIFLSNGKVYKCSYPPSYFEFLCDPNFHNMLQDNFVKNKKEEIMKQVKENIKKSEEKTKLFYIPEG